MRVLFWGTSLFGIPSLRALIGEGFDLAGVVTQPDRPVGRSRSTLVPPAVKEVALAEKLPVFQPEKLRDSEFCTAIRALEPDISVVISYGKILSQEIIDIPRRGTVNVHASLLPKLRGASPIQTAIREGFIETGVTVMRMVARLDAGPIIFQARTPIAEDETAGELELRLSELGALALVETLTLLELGKAAERPQDETAATFTTLIDRGMTRVNWLDEAGTIARFIRAYDPRPGAYSSLNGKDVKMFGAAATDDTGTNGGPSRKVGEVLSIDGSGMLIACGDGAVRVSDVQPSGKRRTSVQDWARGHGVRVGDRFGD
ncbi:MAG: methionyl-tRNA formyltransferase [Gemmatimonadaceae bacterium]